MRRPVINLKKKKDDVTTRLKGILIPLNIPTDPRRIRTPETAKNIQSKKFLKFFVIIFDTA